MLYICHADCNEEAETLKALVEEEIKFKDIVLNYAGNAIGAHAGPGALAVIYLGKHR